ncbi:MAG TPA: GNAT family N-acetyltransferase [Chloroflexota bacterium]|nr:GNAT family N-acetyltransferase [Chloroflexota bacterium]
MTAVRAPRDLGDGLILRPATTGDSDALVAFNSVIHRRPGTSEPDVGIAAWTHDLTARPHPTTGPGDFTVVEDTRSGQIVSTVCLISQTWSYGGASFGVGRPELVGTLPEHRRRGLVRAQFEEIHRWSAGQGELVQAITGIPNYYRQFGYEMALNLHGARSAAVADVPSLKVGESEPFRVRAAGEADLPFLSATYEEGTRRSLVAAKRDSAIWRYELSGRSKASGVALRLAIIQAADGRPVGILFHRTNLWEDSLLGVDLYELAPGVSWLAVTPSVLRYLKGVGEAAAARTGKSLSRLVFRTGLDHPVARVFPEVFSRTDNPYAWYLRVPDLPAFLRRITPVLETRLAASLAPGYTGELHLSFYRSVLRLTFLEGRLGEVVVEAPGEGARADAAFTGLTFLHLLFGHRSLAELRQAYPDVWANREARVILDAIFPKQESNVLPIE